VRAVDEHDEGAARLPGRWVAAGVVFLAIQALLPFAMRATEPPAPLGWQMFSRGALTLEFDVHHGDGRIERLGARNLVIHNRGDIPYHRLLPRLLCRRDGVVAIAIERGGVRRVVPCD
jgi:hypothetical protein